MLKKIRVMLEMISEKETLFKAIKIAIVVGIILNLINQGGAILAFDIENINFFKMGLTFCVPFCVSLYTALTIGLKFQIGTKTPVDVSLDCVAHKEDKVSLKKGDVIPVCPSCGVKTHWKLSGS
ncbi:MAG: nitrate/nitrite transporter NrtS [Campylobacterales bacterium]|nr:nitrate/nitrite transporter NrtS [Campylobacterales bacterium]